MNNNTIEFIIISLNIIGNCRNMGYFRQRDSNYFSYNKFYVSKLLFISLKPSKYCYTLGLLGYIDLLVMSFTIDLNSELFNDSNYFGVFYIFKQKFSNRKYLDPRSVSQVAVLSIFPSQKRTWSFFGYGILKGSS